MYTILNTETNERWEMEFTTRAAAQRIVDNINGMMGQFRVVRV